MSCVFAGVRQLVGNSREPLCLPGSRNRVSTHQSFRTEGRAYAGLIEGQRVRIKSGSMRQRGGRLVRNCSELRFVLTVHFIHQHVALEVDASTLEPIIN